ncbi:MAG: hypothetical protein CMF59_02010 [Leptospiraceae bacterium]|nr:hypothetical protein [Leptospiraceae bacterium]
MSEQALDFRYRGLENLNQLGSPEALCQPEAAKNWHAEQEKTIFIETLFRRLEPPGSFSTNALAGGLYVQERPCDL